MAAKPPLQSASQDWARPWGNPENILMPVEYFSFLNDFPWPPPFLGIPLLLFQQVKFPHGAVTGGTDLTSGLSRRVP
jgi:hypothetical protein